MKISEILEAVAKGSIVIVGALYTTGLIVASIRLAQLGVVSLEFIKPLYVLTGVWVCLPLALATAVLFTYLRALGKADGKPPPFRKRLLRHLGALLAAAFAVFTLGLPFVVVRGSAKTFLMGFGTQFASNVFSLALFGLLIAVTTHYALKDARKRDAPAVRHLSLVSPLSLGALYLVIFSLTLYLQIPAQLGGGGVRTFALVIDEPTIRQAITGDTKAKSPVITPVLAETATTYILPAPKVRWNEFSLNPALSETDDWGAAEVAGPSFVMVPKSAVAAATVIGSRPGPKTNERIKEEMIEKIEARKNENGLVSPSP